MKGRLRLRAGLGRAAPGWAARGCDPLWGEPRRRLSVGATQDGRGTRGPGPHIRYALARQNLLKEGAPLMNNPLRLLVMFFAAALLLAAVMVVHGSRGGSSSEPPPAVMPNGRAADPSPGPTGGQVTRPPTILMPGEVSDETPTQLWLPLDNPGLLDDPARTEAWPGLLGPSTDPPVILSPDPLLEPSDRPDSFSIDPAR